mmetsp:Transcript_11643/g.24480  ORF Transcript_11643/g.24480 Transcript_11643/m.24480 type:complete len:235 (+) Transcript_11643:248-952(+)
MTAALRNLLCRQSTCYLTIHSNLCTIQPVSRFLATSAQKRAAKRFGGKPPTPTPPPLHLNPKIPTRSKFYVDESVLKVNKGKKSSKSIADYVMEKPFIFMVVVFPTVMTGVALIVRKDFRAQLGIGEKKTEKTQVYDAEKSTESPTYGTEISTEEEEKIFADIQKMANEGAVEHSTSITQENSIPESDAESPGQSQLSSDGSENNVDTTTNAGETRDFIYALGFRPHPSELSAS